MPIHVDPLTSHSAFTRTMSLARAYKLSSYDAAYLELVIRESVPLATLDKNLIKAAKKAKVEILILAVNEYTRKVDPVINSHYNNYIYSIFLFLVIIMTICIKSIGVNLKKSRKKTYPQDTVAAFAVRCEIGLSTYKKMEKGDLTVALNYYYLAAEVLGRTSEFEDLFKEQEDWFND